MPAPAASQWSHEEAALLTIVSTSKGALSLTGLLLRNDLLLPELSWQEFAAAMGRLVAADLVISVEQRFLVASLGCTISPGEPGRYFKDLFEETRLALDEHVLRPSPADLPVTHEDFAQAWASSGPHPPRPVRPAPLVP